MSGHYDFRQVFAAACLGMFLFGMVIMSLGSVLPILITTFDLNEVEAGLLASTLTIGILVGSLVFGPIVDRYSYRNLLIVCTLILLGGLECLAYAPRFNTLLLAFFLIGAGGGALNGGTNALVADISIGDADKRGANLSFLGVFFGIGALGMPTIIGILTSRFHYQGIIASLGGIVLIPLIYFFLIQFPKPKQAQGISVKDGFKLMKEAPLILFGLFLCFQSGLEAIIINWSTIFLEKIVQLTPVRALFALSTYILCLTLTRILLMGLLNRIRPYRVMIVSFIIVAIGISATYWHTIPFFPLIGLALLGIGVAAGFPIVLGYVSTLYASHSGTAFGFIFAISLAGNVMLNYLMGFFSQNNGLGIYNIFLSICFLFMVLLLYLSLRQIKGQTRI